MTLMDPASSSEDNSKAQIFQPILPPEIWIYILRLASNLQSSPIDDHHSFPDFPHANIDLWEPGRHQPNHESHHSLSTKRHIARVCRDWYAWCTPFLYEDILVGRHPCSALLLRTLQQSLVSEASQSSHKLTLSNPDSAATRNLEVAPLELAKVMGAGRHVKRIAICKGARANPTDKFMASLALIFQCCPNVVSFSASWETRPPEALMNVISKLYSCSLTHLCWQHPLVLNRRTGDYHALVSFVQPFQSLQVLDLRCLGFYGIDSGQPKPRKGCIRLPTVQRVYIAHSRGNASLLQFLALPMLNHIVLDIGTNEEVDHSSTAWREIIERCIRFILKHRAELSCIQLISSTSAYIPISSVIMLYLIGIARIPAPRLTRLELPLVSMLTMESNGRVCLPSVLCTRPMPNVTRLDLRVATCPPRSIVYRTKYESALQNMGYNYPRGTTKKLFPGLKEVRVVDMSWNGMFDAVSGLLAPVYTALAESTDVPCLDMEGSELTKTLLDDLLGIGVIDWSVTSSP